MGGERTPRVSLALRLAMFYCHELVAYSDPTGPKKRAISTPSQLFDACFADAAMRKLYNLLRSELMSSLSFRILEGKREISQSAELTDVVK